MAQSTTEASQAEATADILRRLDRLESKEEIRALSSSYAAACDEHDLPRLMDLFTDDACFDASNGMMVADSKSAIEALFINTFKVRGPGYHWTHDITIAMDAQDPNSATGLVMSHAETTPNGVVSIAAMRYADTYRRERDQVWRFSNRLISFFYYVPAAQYASSLDQLNRVYMGGEHQAADYPERLAPWQAFIDAHGQLQLDKS